MKKRTDRQPVARAALVVLRDGSCLWFSRATVKRSRAAIRVRTADGVDVVAPAAGTDCLTYDASEERPEPIAQLVNAIDGLIGGGLGEGAGHHVQASCAGRRRPTPTTTAL